MALKKKALFAGSFDPITNGHLFIIKEALKDFDELTILVAINENKKAHYSLSKRVKFIKIVTKSYPYVKVASTKGLTVNYAKKHHIQYLIRGVRNQKDIAYENKLKKMNQKLNSKIKTVIYKSPVKYKDISSSKVISLIKKGEDVSPFINKTIINLL